MTKPTGRPRGRPKGSKDRRPRRRPVARPRRRKVTRSTVPAGLTDADRLAVAILSLTPQRRRRLDAMRAVPEPVRSCDLAAATDSRAWTKTAVHKDLVYLWSHGLLSRSGSGRSIRYCLAPGVGPLMDAFRSVASPRSRMDPRVGVAVLEAARTLVAEGQHPSTRIVAEMAGISQGGAWKWRERLAMAGLWPSADGTRMTRKGRNNHTSNRRRWSAETAA